MARRDLQIPCQIYGPSLKTPTGTRGWPLPQGPVLPNTVVLGVVHGRGTEGTDGRTFEQPVSLCKTLTCITKLYKNIPFFWSDNLRKLCK